MVLHKCRQNFSSCFKIEVSTAEGLGTGYVTTLSGAGKPGIEPVIQ